MSLDTNDIEICDNVAEAIRLIKVASAILDGAEEYVASALLMQAMHVLAEKTNATETSTESEEVRKPSE